MLPNKALARLHRRSLPILISLRKPSEALPDNLAQFQCVG